jgi:putative thioredoxin
MSATIEVTLENFEDTVIHGSMERPVVVEFFLVGGRPGSPQGPNLELLSREMDFVLARIDVEKNQQLAAHFRLTALPDLRVFSKGKMVDMVTGSVTEVALRKRLSKFFLSEFDLALLEAESLLQQGNTDLAMPILDQLLSQKPTDKKVLYCKAKALVDSGSTEDAKAILRQFSEGDDFFREAKALGELMDFHQECAKKDITDPIDLQYQNACGFALQGQYREALEDFLQITQANKNWRDGAARKAMLTLFGVLGPKHELTWEYRSKLNTVLFI